MLSATTYLEPVAHGGGALVWWPRSHHAMHRFLLDNPPCLGPMEQDEGGGPPPALSAFMGEYGRGHPPAEYLGKPGDVLLWHSQNMHGGSANISARPRLGLFARWSALSRYASAVHELRCRHRSEKGHF